VTISGTKDRTRCFGSCSCFRLIMNYVKWLFGASEIT